MAEKSNFDAAGATTSPPVPPKNPARLSRIYTTMGNDENDLSRGLIDLWEHGALLYHSYEWQEAAETFLYLSRVIEQDLQSTFCLLNAVIIFARLGDFSVAAQVLEEAKRIDETLALTLFIMGHVEFQLDHFDKAEYCFRAALSVVQGPNLKFARYGFDFTLWTSQIREDLLVFDSDLSNMNAVLASFPADYLFEAPGRSAGSAAAPLRPRSSFDNRSLPTLSEGSESPIDEPSTPVDETQSLGFPGIREPTWDRQSDRPDFFEGPKHEPSIRTPVVTKLGGESTKRTASRASKIMSPLRRLSQRPLASRSLEYLLPRRPVFTPREARVQDDSVQELSEYIKDLPSQHDLKPRDAEADFGDVRGLSDFLNAGPPRDGGARPDHVSMNSTASYMSGSGNSTYSDDFSADSVDSNELIGMPQAQTPRRSTLPLSRPRSKAERKQQPTSGLHPLLTTLVGDVSDDDGWPPTPDASEIVRHTPPSNSTMQGNLYFELQAPSPRPSIPTRNSSLKPSPLMRPNITEQDHLDGWTGTPNRLSMYQYMTRHGIS